VLRPLSLIVDFDGTITTEDVGAALCDRFAPGVLERVDARWLAGEITFGEAYRLACLELKAPHADLVEHALEVGRVRAGFGELVEATLSAGGTFMVASAGLDLYVEPILRRELGPGLQRLLLRANAATVTAGGIEVRFPHEHPDCRTCANCKGIAAREHREDGRRVVGVGDSFTDLCLAREAEHVFARAWLSEHCTGAGIAHETFDDFHPVTALVRRLTS
jgi:2-hydroxy-3-keto-5-methylthiopentenyl-1-phosphate phosphatase